MDKFSDISGLTINQAKSSLYLSDVDMDIQNSICGQLGFQQGVLPDVSSSSNRSCSPSKFTGLQCSSFRAPSSGKYKVSSLDFYGRARSLSHVGAKVARHSICYPLREGGLGINNLKPWNKAATMKHIWKILQSREGCRSWFIKRIGNGSSTSLWYDYWLPDGKKLIDILPLRVLTSTGLSWASMVSNIIHGSCWNFPNILELESTWNTITFNPHLAREDQLIWTGHHSGEFTIKSAWELIRDKRLTNNMYHLLWFKGHIPRQSFILWLASLGRLRTLDRLHGAETNTTCILCGLHVETHEHLFFECKLHQLSLGSYLSPASMQWPCKPWKHLLQWAASYYKKKNDSDHMIARLLLSTTVYFLWHERNNRVFTNTAQTYQTTAEVIFQQIRTRIANMDHASTIPARTRAIWNV
ncbi:PREDICTED: uncharacterized protein LOC105113923 [Populus euphratica]|uniref:Uncharacterized protein LOC105113923 n=1 Tax=Populus euphratica TaxID=75702 RepID=A0AAJ6X7V8_POPEU|nr:PREDICTED: uncharacterized protein LOC105113923 [Populus euphratica]